MVRVLKSGSDFCFGGVFLRTNMSFLVVLFLASLLWQAVRLIWSSIVSVFVFFASFSFLGYLFQYFSRRLLSHLSIYLRFPRLVLLCPFCNHRRCLCYCCLFFFAVKCHSHHYCRGRVAVSHYIQYIPERLSPEVERSNISSVGFLHMIQLLQLLVRSELEGSVDAGELVADGGG